MRSSLKLTSSMRFLLFWEDTKTRWSCHCVLFEQQKSHWRCAFQRRPHSLAHNPYPTYAREWGLLWNSHLQWDFRCSKRTQRHGQTSLWLSYPSPARLLNKQMEYRERVKREPDLYIPSTIKTIFIRSLLITIAELDPAIDLHSCSFIIPANYVLEWMGLNIFWL